MSNWLKNADSAWTADDDARLQYLAAGNTPTGVIALYLGRSEAAVRTRAVLLGVSLKPTNQSPYNRR